MKNILIVAHLQSHIMNFHIPVIKYLQGKGYKVYIATKLDTERYEEACKNLIDVEWRDIEFNRNPFSKNTIVSLRQMKDLMNEVEFSLIHVNTPIAAFISRLAAKLTNSKPIIYTAHGFHFYKGAPVKNWAIYYTAEKIASRWTDGIITMNEEDFNTAKQKLNLRRKNSVFKINGVGVDINKYSTINTDISNLKKEVGVSNDDFILTMIGEINKNKNQKQLLEALNNISIALDHLKILIVGEGDEEKQNLESLIKQYNLEKNVIFLGFRNDIPNILGISDIILSLSEREGLPKNVMEAMAAGVPIIATNVRGNNELVINNHNGMLVEYGDFKKTAECIETLYNNTELYESMKLRNTELAKQYSIEFVLNQMEKIYSNYIQI